MAHTAHKTLERLEEVEWSLDRIREAAAHVAALMRESTHTVFFTGAGISTSAGVPDFRGPDGVWTRAAQGKEAPAASVNMQEAIPTPTHMAMRALHQHGLLHFVISQNVDGLHRKSGIPHSAIAELHGNSNVEQCELCGKRYMRDFAFHSNRSHFTGRVCSATGCSGRLRNTIINFGENLPMVELANGFAHSEKASLHVALGTSLTVRPACDMPIATKDRGGKLVIVNLQRTPLDQMCDVRVHGRVDAFVQCLMECLEIPIPAFAVERRVALWTTPEGRLAVAGVDTDGSPQYLCSAVAVNGRRTQIEREQWADPLCTDFTVDTAAAPCEVALEFFGHYREPELRLSLPANFTHGSWRITVLPGGAAWTAVADSEADAVTPSYEKGDRSATQLVTQPDAVEDRTGIDYTGWFAVTPLEYCVHCEAVALCDGATFDVAQPCQECGNVGENMQCLSCHEVHCGRHVKQHMLAHYEASKHAIVMGFADLSAWCYECQSYINTGNRKLRQVYSLMHQAKFGFPPRSR